MIKIKNNNIKELNNIAVPLIIQSISGLLIGLADQAMVGRISIFAYGAVGVVFSLLSLIAGIIGYLSVTFNINGAKALGRRDANDFQDEFTSTLILNLVIGFSLLIIILIIKRPLLVLLYGFQGEILDEAVKYLNIMSSYVLIQLLLFNFAAVFKVEKNTKWILIGSTTAAILNLVLDYVLIFGKFGFPKLGVTGAAIATIISLVVNLLIYAFLCKQYVSLKIKKIDRYKAKFKKCIKESIPFMGQELLEGSIFVLVINAIVSRIGVVDLSSYLILVQLVNIVLMPMYMYGSATLTLISQSDGEENQDLLVDIPKVSIYISIAIYIFISIVFILFRNYVPRLITDDPKVISLSANLLIYMLIAHLLDPVCTIYKYSLQSLSEGKYVLFQTAKVNCAILLLMIALTYIMKFNIYGVLLPLFINYFLLCIIYINKYNKTINNKYHMYEEKNVIE